MPVATCFRGLLDGLDHKSAANTLVHMAAAKPGSHAALSCGTREITYAVVRSTMFVPKSKKAIARGPPVATES